MEIEHIAFNVPDPVALADWYVRHLGMVVVRSVAGVPFTRFLADSAGRTVLEVYCQTKAALPNYQDWDPLVTHIAFKVSDLQSEVTRLVAAGAVPAGEAIVNSSGDEMAFLRDPWGLTIQLIKRRTPLMANQVSA